MQKNRVSTGISGLDEILQGGFLREKSYLLRGGPGTGKSTFGYKFLEKGVLSGEKSLLITLGESEEGVKGNAETLGIDFSGIEILDLSPRDQLYKEASSYTVFPSSDVEAGPLLNELISNSAKHGYSPGDEVSISITMQLIGENELELVYRDYGTGLKEDVDLRTAGNFGWTIIRMLLKQLKAEWHYWSDNGLHFHMRFQRQRYTGPAKRFTGTS